MQTAPKNQPPEGVRARGPIHRRKSVPPVPGSPKRASASPASDSTTEDDDEYTWSNNETSTTVAGDSFRRSSSNDRSRNDPRRLDRSNRETTQQQLLKNLTYESYYTPPHSCLPEVQNTSSMWLCVAIVVGLLICGFSAFQFLPAAETQQKSCSYAELRSRYAKQDDKLWLSLTVGIENILNERSDKPCVFLFLHQGGARMHRLVEEIAKQSSRCFGGPEQLVQMPEKYFTSPKTLKDYGLAIEEYKLKVKQGHVVLIANLNKIPVETAPALHTICDIYSPIAKDVIIILTLEAPNSKVLGNPSEIASDTLTKLWGDKLPRDHLGPLLTRLTDQVIPLNS